MRLLYARCGTVHCIVCDGIVKRDSVDEIAAAVLALGEGTRLHAIFPVQQANAASPARRSSQARNTHKARTARPQASSQESRSQSRPAHRSPQRAPHRPPPPRLQSPLPGRTDLRILHPRVHCSNSTSPCPVFVLVDRIVVSAENRARIVDAAEIGYREVRRNPLRRSFPREDPDVRPRAPPLLHRLRMQDLPPRLPRARAAPLLLQQSLRRLPALPGLRQHHRLRSRSHHPRQVQDPSTTARSTPGTAPSTAPTQTELKRIAKQHGIPTRRPLVRPAARSAGIRPQRQQARSPASTASSR